MSDPEVRNFAITVVIIGIAGWFLNVLVRCWLFLQAQRSLVERRAMVCTVDRLLSTSYRKLLEEHRLASADVELVESLAVPVAVAGLSVVGQNDGGDGSRGCVSVVFSIRAVSDRHPEAASPTAAPPTAASHHALAASARAWVVLVPLPEPSVADERPVAPDWTGFLPTGGSTNVAAEASVASAVPGHLSAPTVRQLSAPSPHEAAPPATAGVRHEATFDPAAIEALAAASRCRRIAIVVAVAWGPGGPSASCAAGVAAEEQPWPPEPLQQHHHHQQQQKVQSMCFVQEAAATLFVRPPLTRRASSTATDCATPHTTRSVASVHTMSPTTPRRGGRSPARWPTGKTSQRGADAAAAAAHRTASRAPLPVVGGVPAEGTPALPAPAAAPWESDDDNDALSLAPSLLESGEFAGDGGWPPPETPLGLSVGPGPRAEGASGGRVAALSHRRLAAPAAAAGWDSSEAATSGGGGGARRATGACERRSILRQAVSLSFEADVQTVLPPKLRCFSLADGTPYVVRSVFHAGADTGTGAAAAVDSAAVADDEEDAALCVVCLCEPSDVITLPCSHLVTCSGCVHRLTCCPLCRSTIETLVTVWEEPRDGRWAPFSPTGSRGPAPGSDQSELTAPQPALNVAPPAIVVANVEQRLE